MCQLWGWCILNRDARENLISEPRVASCPQSFSEGPLKVGWVFNLSVGIRGWRGTHLPGVFSIAPWSTYDDLAVRGRWDGKPRQPAVQAGWETKYPVSKGSSANPGNYKQVNEECDEGGGRLVSQVTCFLPAQLTVFALTLKSSTLKKKQICLLWSFPQ